MYHKTEFRGRGRVVDGVVGDACMKACSCAQCMAMHWQHDDEHHNHWNPVARFLESWSLGVCWTYLYQPQRDYKRVSSRPFPLRDTSQCVCRGVREGRQGQDKVKGREDTQKAKGKAPPKNTNKTGCNRNTGWTEGRHRGEEGREGRKTRWESVGRAGRRGRKNAKVVVSSLYTNYDLGLVQSIGKHFRRGTKL